MKTKWSSPENWIIDTKLSPPLMPTKDIRRQRLLEAVTIASDYQLTIIHAPAGYGKTTFLKQWYERHLQADGIASWLSLDEEEQNANLFLRYMAAALREAGVSCEALERACDHGVESLPASSVAAIAIHILQAFSRPLLVFFDDYHLVENDWINQLLHKIVTRAPANLEIVISSRLLPSLVCEDLRGLDKIREISVQELSFSLEEASLAMDEAVSHSDLHALWRKAEGWPIACHMVSSLIRKQSFPVAEISAFSGRTRDLAVYITEQVFSALSLEEQSFLLHTSVPGRFSGELAKVLCPGVDCWSILDSLLRDDFFLVSLDQQGKWYRYHQLFREYLYERLRRSAKKRLLKLHSKSAKWLFDQGVLSEALDHSLKAEDHTLAARMLDGLGGWRLVYQDRLDWLAALLQRIDERVAENFPRLFLAEIVIHSKLGNTQEASRRARLMSAKTNGFETWEGEPLESELRLEVELVKALFLQGYADAPVSQATLSFMTEHLALVRHDDHILRALLHDALIGAYVDAGDLVAADSHIDDAQTNLRVAGHHYGELYVLYHRANVHLERAKLGDAVRELRRAEQITAEYFGSNSETVLNTSVFLAEIAYLQSDLAQASRLLDGALEKDREHDGWFELFAKAYVTSASLAYITSGVIEARRVLDLARDTADRRGLPRLRILGDLTEVKILLLSGMLGEAQDLAEKIDIECIAKGDSHSGSISVFLPERAKLVAARLRLERGNARGAREILNPLAEELEQSGRVRLLVESWLLTARAALALADRSSAKAIFEKAVQASMHETLMRPFIDEGQGLADVLSCLRGQGESYSDNRFCRDFLDRVSASISKERKLKEVSAWGGLTQKEYRVVVELGQGLTNKEIATLLYVSEDAIKYRLKHLFKKLGVGSRQDAVRVARDKALIS